MASNNVENASTDKQLAEAYLRSNLRPSGCSMWDCDENNVYIIPAGELFCRAPWGPDNYICPKAIKYNTTNNVRLHLKQKHAGLKYTPGKKGSHKMEEIAAAQVAFAYCFRAHLQYERTLGQVREENDERLISNVHRSTRKHKLSQQQSQQKDKFPPGSSQNSNQSGIPQLYNSSHPSSHRPQPEDLQQPQTSQTFPSNQPHPQAYPHPQTHPPPPVSIPQSPSNSHRAPFTPTDIEITVDQINSSGERTTNIWRDIFFDDAIAVDQWPSSVQSALDNLRSELIKNQRFDDNEHTLHLIGYNEPVHCGILRIEIRKIFNAAKMDHTDALLKFEIRVKQSLKRKNTDWESDSTAADIAIRKRPNLGPKRSKTNFPSPRSLMTIVI